MKISFQNPPKNLDEKMVYNIMRDYKMLNCEVLVRDENGMLLVKLWIQQYTVTAYL
jgi:ribosome-interacting GTPase 1